jgi:hypothetical protein
MPRYKAGSTGGPVLEALPPTRVDVASRAGATATARTRVGLGSSVGTTACRWGRRAVVTQQLLIGLFELKIDRLNMKSIV